MSFSNLLTTTPRPKGLLESRTGQTTKKDEENLLPFMFYTLLHLANENGLALESKGDDLQVITRR